MSCYHPLRLFRSGCVNPQTGKDYVLVSSYNFDFVTKADFDKRDIPTTLTPSERLYSYQSIPCGKCVGCRSDYGSRWTSRVIAESFYHCQNWFITLTYDNDHLPEDGFLHKEDLQKFFKRLRSAGKQFRYLCCGEYGDKFSRPHYHGCFFGLELDDLSEFSSGKAGKLFVSPFLSKIWGLGFVLIGNLDYGSAAYVCRYVLKKRGSWSEEKPPFFLMSKKPAIGSQFFEANIKEGAYILPLGNGSVIRCGLPHYLRLKYDLKAGDVEKLAELERIAASNGNFLDIDSYRDFKEFQAYHPIRKQ